MAGKARLKVISPPKQLIGEITVPGDKSISHRALILGSLALGASRLANISTGRDCLATANCLKSLGVRIARQGIDPSAMLVNGFGLGGWVEAKDVLNARNSGTTMRLLAGVLVARPFLSVLTGDISLRARPMKRLIEPLRLMGGEIYGRGNDSFAPLVIKGRSLHGVTYSLPVASAQIKTAILLAGLFANGDTTVEEPQICRDHTERLLKRMGANLETDSGHIRIAPLDTELVPVDIVIPGDISSVAYWLVAGAIHPDARVRITNCGVNPTRTGILDALVAMGARLKVENRRLEGNEAVADLCVESSQLKATEIIGDLVPRLIDEIPLVAVAASVARGDTIVRGASELRVKESDRINTTVQELSRLGAAIEELPDGMLIHGGRKLQGAEVDSHFDHRLAMSLAVAGLVATGSTRIRRADVAEISYPGFWKALDTLARY